MVTFLVYSVEGGCLESYREDIHATTIPLLESLNLHVPVHTLEFEGAWPCRLVCLSWHAQYTLDMVLGTRLEMVLEVVAMPDQLRAVVSSEPVEVVYW